MENEIKKVLVLGSGALKIGEAGEFDYSGSQAIKALKEEGIKVILINPNIATIQTSEGMADKIYFLPIKPEFVEKVIEKEKPDGIFLSFGGQTALNCGVELHKLGIFKKYNVKILGTPIDAIINSEDRELFVKVLNEVNVKTPRSFAVSSVADALNAAERIGYPIIVRIAYALGGKGSGLTRNKEELEELAKKSFSYSNQILVEEYLGGWKEVEYEVVRDKYDNCITVCNMENFDPLGIHTGESIVVAPSQTLTNNEYHKLRSISIKVIRKLGIIGECNIQFALDPNSEDYRIIEVNARLSRSSALASKATGYPLAFIAAKLALGYGLTELENSITKKTKACFEPALDYIVVKIPRWDLKKFKRVSKYIDSSMKSVGEVMAIGRKFEEALQKAVRMLQVGMFGVVCNQTSFNDIRKALKQPTDERLFAIPEALKQGISVEEIYSLTGIDKWFLYKIQNIIESEQKILKEKNLSKDLLKEAKQNGFSDKQIAVLLQKKEEEIRALRKNLGITSFIKQIDTLGAEYPAKTNYLYLTYNASGNDIEVNSSNNIIVLGSGSYSIGSSVEFDWCCVNAVLTLNRLGYETVMINYNPETVSTDYDVCSRLYFDELSFETVADIYEKENPMGIIISMGGQIPNNIAIKCFRNNMKILGTSPLSIDNAEDRKKFSQILDELGVEQPRWKALTNINDAEEFAESTGYPILVRPSYVLSGAAMSVVFDKKELDHLLKKATDVSQEHPVVLTKFILNAKEIEIDAVAKDGKIIVSAISEHVENAGVHSGDATLVFPAQRTYFETMKKIKEIASKIAYYLRITGPFNIQFLAKNNEVSVIECNLRASRSFPFVSKVAKINFIELAVRSMLGLDVQNVKSTLDLQHVGVKAPHFSFTRLKGADPVLGVEMASTGEVGCIGDDFHEAFLKSLLSVGYNIPEKNILLSTGPIESKAKFLPSAKLLVKMGFNLYSTEGTARFLEQNGIKSTILHWPLDKEKKPNVIDYLEQKKIDLVINIPKNYQKEELTNGYLIRRKAVDHDIPLITNLQLAQRFVESISREINLKIKSWDEY